MKGRMRLIFFGVVALQLLFILGLVAYKEVTLRFGTEVVLQTVPVDPRDLFRGDYVVLRYEVSTLESTKVCCVYDVEQGDRVFVHLVPSTTAEGEGVWSAIAVAKEVGSDWDVFLKGRVVDYSGDTIRVEYGIESYFVPEGQGLEIERAQDVKARVAVNGFGEGVIKGLIVDGEPWKPR
jgi:uncharacterized membrane-anchored protein